MTALTFIHRLASLGREFGAELRHPAARKWHTPFLALVGGMMIPWILRVVGSVAPGFYDNGVLPLWFDGVMAEWWDVVPWRWLCLLAVVTAAWYRGGPRSTGGNIAVDMAGGAMLGAAMLYDWWYYAPWFVAACWWHLMVRHTVRYWACSAPAAFVALIFFLGLGGALFVDGQGGAFLERRLGMGFSRPTAALCTVAAACGFGAITAATVASRMDATEDNRRKLRLLVAREPRMSEYFALVRRVTPPEKFRDPWVGAEVQFAPAASPGKAFASGAAGQAEPRRRIDWRAEEDRAFAWVLEQAKRGARLRLVARAIALGRPRVEGHALPAQALLNVLTAERAKARLAWREKEARRLRIMARGEGTPDDEEAASLGSYVLLTEASIEAEDYFLLPQRLEPMRAPAMNRGALHREWSQAAEGFLRGQKRVADETAPEWRNAASRYADLWSEVFIYWTLSWKTGAGGNCPVDLARLMDTWLRLERAHQGEAASSVDLVSFRFAAALWMDIHRAGAEAAPGDIWQQLGNLARCLRRLAAARELTLSRGWSLAVALTAACYLRGNDPMRAMGVLAPFESRLLTAEATLLSSEHAVISAVLTCAAWQVERERMQRRKTARSTEPAQAAAAEGAEGAADFGGLSFVFNCYGVVATRTTEEPERTALRFARGFAP